MKLFCYEPQRIAALCRGVLVDELRAIFQGKRIQQEQEQIFEAEINCSMEQLEEREDTWSGHVRVWRDTRTGSFALDCEGVESGDSYSIPSHQELYTILDLRTTLIPEWQTDEYTCTLRRGDDGRLSGRIEYRSDRDGCFDKLVFPDRSWKTAIAGNCHVKIVKDLPGYAFVTGDYSIKNTPAGIDDVIQRLWDETKCGIVKPTAKVFEVKDSLAGSFVGIAEAHCYYAFVEAVEAAERICRETVCTADQEEMTADLAAHTEWELTAEDLLIQYAFDSYNSADELFSRFKPSRCSGDAPGGNRVGYWLETRLLGTHAPSIAHVAQNLGVLRQKELLSQHCAANAISICRDNIYLLASFSSDEVEELIRFVNEANAEADARIRSAAKKGKIKLV